MVLNPNININVNESLSLIPGVNLSTIMIMGTAQWGPLNRVLSFSDFNNILETYKEDVNNRTSIIKAASLAYANGARNVKVLRVGNSAAKAAVTINSLTFTAKHEGIYGNNFTVDIDDQGTGRIVTITNGNYRETFDNNGATNGYTSNDDIVSAINNESLGSSIIDASKVNNTLVTSSASAQSLTGGNNGDSSLVANDYGTAFDNYLALEDWDILVIGSSGGVLETSDSFHSTMVTKVNTRANNNRYSMFIAGTSLNESVSSIKSRTTRNGRFILCAPSIEVTSRVSNTDEILNGSYTAAVVAGMIAGRPFQESITRKVVGVNDFLIDATSGKKYYNNLEIEDLLNSGVCVLSQIGGTLKVARGVTRISNVTSIYYEITIRRIVDNIENRIRNLLDGFLGEPNVMRNRTMIAAEVDGVLNAAVADEEITAYRATQVTEGNNPDTINVSLTLQPTFTINFINVVISVSRT